MGEEMQNNLWAIRSTIELASKQLHGLRCCVEMDELYKKEILECENKLINMFAKLLLTQSKLNHQNNNQHNNNPHNNDNFFDKSKCNNTEIDNNNNTNNNSDNKTNNINNSSDNNDTNNNTTINNNDFSDVEYWLKVVGLNKDLINTLNSRMTLMEMVGMSADGLKDALKDEIKGMSVEGMKDESAAVCDEELKVLCTAVNNLQIEMKCIVNNCKSNLDLSWSTFKNASPHNPNSNHTLPHHTTTPYTSNSPKPPRHHPHQFHQQRPSTSALPTDTTTLNKNHPPSTHLAPNHHPSNHHPSNHLTPSYSRSTLPTMTPPPTPFSKTSKKFPATPPLGRKIRLNFEPLTKSKSHESQLSIRISQDTLDLKKRFFKKKVSGNLVSSSDALVSSPSHLHTPHHNNHSISDDGLSSSNVNQPQVPPTSPDLMSHKFNSRPMWGSCDLCQRQLIFISRVCKHCKVKLHHDCVPKYNKMCHGSPGPLSKHNNRNKFLLRKHGGPLKQQLQPLNHQQQLLLNNQQQQLLHQQQQLLLNDSSSTSSCNSSTPSSPSTTTLTSTHFQQQQHQQHQHLYNSENTHFKYPEPGDSFLDGTFETNKTDAPVSDVITTTDSDKSDKTITGSGCSSGDQTSCNIEHTDSLDSNDGHHALNRDHSISLKELSIPYEELKVLERVGEGRFGTVYKGFWHGDVAIKQLNTREADDDNLQQIRRQAFKAEVAGLKKCRHETLVLFMGASVQAHNLAIITSFIDGSSINEMIHQQKKRFALNQVINIASQVAQGLGYLHAKEIVHKHLNLNNTFLSNNNNNICKVVITDYGLSLDQLCKSSREGQWLSIPAGWLSYQSPEIIRTLTPSTNLPHLPFSKQSDVYAFGTIWYELLTGKRLHHGLRAEEVIWVVGNGGSRPKMNHPAEYVEVSSSCWSAVASERPTCAVLLRKLECLPRKRLSRSPSHPLQITRASKPLF